MTRPQTADAASVLPSGQRAAFLRGRLAGIRRQLTDDDVAAAIVSALADTNTTSHFLCDAAPTEEPTMAANDYDDDESPFDERGLLKDGRKTRISLMMRDSVSDVQRAIMQDKATRGLSDALCRHQPGPAIVADRSAAREAWEEARRQGEIAWRGDAAEPAADRRSIWEEEQEDARPPIPVTDADFARLRQIKQAAYERAKRQGEHAWKTRSASAADVAPPVRQDAAPPTYDIAEGRRRKQAALNEMISDMCSAWKGPLR
jgi:hypothetical protein